MAHYYWDETLEKVVEGFPPAKVKTYGEGPFIITDEMPAYRHPMTGQYLTSKSALRQVDRACGTITTDKKLPPETSQRRENARKLKDDQHRALHKAVAQLEAGTAPLTEETRQMCERQNEIISSALNFDAFNVVGRKKNAKGKKFRRK